jgi:hypothetical protein
MPAKEIVSSDAGPESGRYAAEVAVAQRIASGDEQSWKTFFDAIRPTVTKVSIDWCHRIAPGGLCHHCVAGVESGCAHFSGVVAKIEEWIHKNAMNVYKGQTSLVEFIEILVSSDWWFWDYSDPLVDRLPPPNKTPAKDGFRADQLQAWAVLAGSEHAWKTFLRDNNKYIEKTAITWCHRTVQGRVCRRCKPGAHDADHSCDAASDAYVYLLGRLRKTALVSYKGRTALNSFVFTCLHDYRWWASLVQEHTGKIKQPKALQGESKTAQKIYCRLCWGWDNERIACEIGLPIEMVEKTRFGIEEKLRSAGVTISPRKLKMISLSEVHPASEDEEPLVTEPTSPDASPEVRSEAMKYWSKLPVRDRNLLKLLVGGLETDLGIRKVTQSEAAKALGLPIDEVRSTLYRIRLEMPEWFRASVEEKFTLQGSVQIEYGSEHE